MVTIQLAVRRLYNYGGILIAALVFPLYLFTLSRDYIGDGLQFAMGVEGGELTDLLTPNHMLYPMMALWLYRCCQILGWQEGALLPVQVLSAIGGAASVGLLYGIARKITHSEAISVVIALGFGVSAAVWLFSTDAESVTIPLAVSLLLLYRLFSATGSTRWSNPVILGVLCSLSIITYQTGVFLVVVVVVGYAMKADMSASVRLRQILLFVSVTGILTATVYLAVAFFVFGIRNWEGLLDWQFSASALGLWGKPTLRSIAQGGHAFTRGIAGYPGITPGSGASVSSLFADATLLQRLVFEIYDIGLAIVALIPLVLAFKMRKPIMRYHSRTLAILAAWGFLYAAFTFYWVGGDISFWVPVLVPWWLLIGILISADGGQRDDGSPKGYRTLFHVTAVGVVIIALINFVNTILPKLDRDHNCSYQIAMSMKEHTSSNDLIITSGAGDKLFLTIPYFGQRRTYSIYHHIINADMPPNRWIVRPPATSVAQRGRRDKDEVFDDVYEMVRQVRSDGGRAFLVGVQPGHDVWWNSLQEVGVDKSDFSRFRTRDVWELCGERASEILQ